MGAIKSRKEVKQEDTWDLSDFYPNEEAYEKDLKEIKQQIQKIKEMKEKFLENVDTFLACLTCSTELDRKLGKAYIYASLKFDEDQGNAKSQERKGKIELLQNEAVQETAFIRPSILEADEKTIRTYLKDERLQDYRHTILDLLRYKDHTLSSQEEKLLASFHNVFKSNDRTASYVRNVDLTFGKVTNEEGEEIELTNSNYAKLITSNSRKVRKDAFETLYKGYASMKNTLSSTYEATIEQDVVSAKVRGYKDSLSMYLYEDKIDCSLYENLIQKVKGKLSSLFRYFFLKKEILGVDQIHLYDLYAPLVEESTKTYTFQEAQEMVLSALSILGDDYQTLLKRAFKERWIDKYPNKGKRGGAYSWGCYDSNPHVLLNFDGTMESISTIAHELGHSLHSYYSIHNNCYQDHNYVIFLAEIASTVNEMLFYNYFLKHSKDRKEKLLVLNEMLDMFKATIYRQTMFAEFELKAHKKREKGDVLTQDTLSQMYYDLNREYFGKDVVVDDEIRYEWLRIPHFYTPFYVYQYATGLSVACYIAKNILEGKEGFKEKYLAFLKTGGRDYPLELLKIVEVDMENGTVIEDAISYMEELLDEFEKTYNEK